MAADAEQIHRDAIVVVDHDHRPLGADIPLMRAGGVTAKVYQVALDVDVEAGIADSAERTEGWLRLATRQMEETLREIEAHSDQCLLVRTAGDIHRAKEEGKIGIALGAEGARWLEESLAPLHLFHRLGLRELQLTWAFANPLVPDGHLSQFGRDVVAGCGELGVIVDVTHIPEAAFYEVVDCARKPVIVSHGSARGVSTDLSDDQIRALAATGGLLGIHFYITYLGENPKPDDVVDQVDYVVDLVGVDHLALGVDFFPTQGIWYRLQVDQGATNLQWAVEDMSQMPAISRRLVERGYGEEDVRKILGLNFLRVCEETFGNRS